MAARFVATERSVGDLKLTGRKKGSRMVRVFSTKDRSKAIFESFPNDIKPFTNALEKMRHDLHLKHPLLVLKNIAGKADDVHLAGSHYRVAAVQLLQLVFDASGYELEVL